MPGEDLQSERRRTVAGWSPGIDRIREAAVSDLDDLSVLLAILFAQESEFHPDADVQRRGLRQILLAPSVGTVLVAVQEGRIIGMVSILYTVSTALGARVALLEDMVVLPRMRRLGVGEALMRAAVDRCHQEGCRRITLLTDHDNDAAHRLYRRGGFARSSMQVFRRLEDAADGVAR